MDLIVEKMNDLGDNFGDIAKNGNLADLLESRGDAEMAKKLRSIEQDAEIEIQRLMEAIASGKLKPPVSYEDSDQSKVTGREADLLRNKWASGLDYLPHVPFFKHFSPLLLHCYLGNYNSFIKHIESLSEEEAKRELKQRETLMQVSPVFHPIIGSKALFTGSPILTETEKVHGKPDMMHIKILKELLDRGAEVNTHDFAGYTPLHYALSSHGNIATLEMAKMLIEKGADVNALNRLGCTPLMEPVIAHKLEAVHLLVKHGADPHITDINGTSPYEIGSKFPDVASLFKLADKKIIARQRTVAKEEQDFKKCAVCKAECKLKCTGCFLEWYCNANCQKADWENHKGTCKVRKAEYVKVEFKESHNTSFNYNNMQAYSSGPKMNNMHSVVKIQVPMHGGLGLGSDAMMVYNKDRSVYGMLAMNSPTANKLASIVKEKGFKGVKGYFYAIKKKGETKGNLYINPNILPPETW